METPQSLLHGANSGGKTVFLRMVGICTILAMAGLPVPAGNMSVPYIGCIHSAFAQKEEIHRGRLQREKEALKHLIASAEPSDLILVNEIFSSTSEPEALELSEETLETFHRCRFYCLWNSHHPLHRLSDVPGMCRYAPSAVERYKIRKEECPLAGAQAIGRVLWAYREKSSGKNGGSGRSCSSKGEGWGMKLSLFHHRETVVKGRIRSRSK